MGLLNDAGAWLAGMLQTGAGVSVTYSRVADPNDTLSLTAWVGRSATATDPGSIRYMQWGERDYLILASDLVANGSRVEPQIGDRQTETISGVEHVFEVCSDANGQHWRWSDEQSRTMYRLHTKRVVE